MLSTLADRIARAALMMVAFAAALLPGAAHAEALSIEGVYASEIAMPGEVERIVVEPFRGDLGHDVEIAVMRRLGDVVVRGEPWFELVSAQALHRSEVRMEGNDGSVQYGLAHADAELRGTVHSEIFERGVRPKLERECVKRDEDGKCIERREYRIECAELTVRVDPRILLIDATGRQIYAHTLSRRQSEHFCVDDHIPSVLDMVNEIVEDIAKDIRRDIAPRERTRNIRVMERRRGLSREDRRTFRDALRLTKSDAGDACRAFAAMEARNPQHVSVLFNIGLCWEYADELERAADYYRLALTIDPGRDYPKNGLGRISSRQRAEAQLASRELLAN